MTEIETTVEMPSKVVPGYTLRRRDYQSGYKRLRAITVWKGDTQVVGTEALTVLRAEMPSIGGVFDEYRLTLLMAGRFPRNAYSFSGAGKTRSTQLDRMEHALRNDGLATVALYGAAQAPDERNPERTQRRPRFYRRHRSRDADHGRPLITLTFDRADLALMVTSYTDMLKELLLQEFTRSDFNHWIGAMARRSWEFVAPADPVQGVFATFLTSIAQQIIMVRHQMVFLAGVNPEGEVAPMIYLGDLPTWARAYELLAMDREIITGADAWGMLTRMP